MLKAKTIYSKFDFNEDVSEFQITTMTEHSGEINCSGEFDVINLEKDVESFTTENGCLYVKVKDGVWRK